MRCALFLFASLLLLGCIAGTADSVQHNRIRIVFAHEYDDETLYEQPAPGDFNGNGEPVPVIQLQTGEGQGEGASAAAATAKERADRSSTYLVSNSVDEVKAARPMAEAVAEGGFVINTWGFLAATEKAWSSLAENGRALDAVEVGCTECEVLQCDTTVGYGGSPDENGETTLDALIMDGVSHSIGAVGCLRRIKPAISVARAVMEHTKHSILVGELATQFAVQMGFVEENLTTPLSAQMHADWRSNTCQPNFWRNVTPDPTRFCGPYRPDTSIKASVEPPRRKIDRFNHDTIGMVVVDGTGAVASGVSSNGARNKIPGRVGDAAIVGAGTYSEGGIGGAAATGDGDVMMRFLPSLLAVEQMRMGRTPGQAAEYAIRRIAAAYPTFGGGIVALNVRGEYGAACHGMERFPFGFRNATMQNAQEFSVYCV